MALSLATYVSRTQEAIDDIVTELKTITTAGGYYNDPSVIRAIRWPDEVVEPPEIGVEAGEEEMKVVDANGEVFSSFVTVYVCGTIHANAALDADSSELVTATEQLRHDIKRIVVSMHRKYAPNTSSEWRWSIVNGSIDTVPVVGLGERRNKAQVWTRFKIHIRSQRVNDYALGHGEVWGSKGYGYWGF